MATSNRGHGGDTKGKHAKAGGAGGAAASRSATSRSAAPGGSGSGADDNRVRVVVRVRPLLESDAKFALLEEDAQECTTLAPNGREIKIAKPFTPAKAFGYDAVLGPRSTQAQTYDAVARDVVADVVAGFNGTILAYGQTGTGKTHTIFGGAGDPTAAEGADVADEAGVVPRAVHELFSHARALREAGADASVSVSFLQIYMESLEDLLLTAADGGGPPLAIRQDPARGIFVENLSRVAVDSPAAVFAAVARAVRARATGSTQQNAVSSRSHAVLFMHLEQQKATVLGGGVDASGSPAPVGSPGGAGVEVVWRSSTLTIVDLAGSERVSKSGSEGIRLEEAKKINKSIAALGNCVAALARREKKRAKGTAAALSAAAKAHIPFRDSQLTRLLTTSLGGNAKTCLCATIGPSGAHYDETHSTLLLAERAMSVRTEAVINEVKEHRTHESSSGSPFSALSGGVPGPSASAVRRTAQLAAANDDLARENAELRRLLFEARAAGVVTRAAWSDSVGDAAGVGVKEPVRVATVAGTATPAAGSAHAATPAALPLPLPPVDGCTATPAPRSSSGDGSAAPAAVPATPITLDGINCRETTFASIAREWRSQLEGAKHGASSAATPAGPSDARRPPHDAAGGDGEDVQQLKAALAQRDVEIERLRKELDEVREQSGAAAAAMAASDPAKLMQHIAKLLVSRGLLTGKSLKAVTSADDPVLGSVLKAVATPSPAVGRRRAPLGESNMQHYR